MVEYVNKVIYQVTSNLKLKHQVKFGKKSQKGERLSPFSKYDYTTKNYNVDMEASSIYLDTNDYLILEYRDKNETFSIYLSYPHLFNFKRFLKNALRWFYNSEYEGMFIYKDDEITFNSKFKDEYLFTDITIEGKSVSLKPSIVERHDIYEEGVIMTLNGEIVVSMAVDELESLYDTIQNFNLYQNSLTLTTYMLTSYPEELLSGVSTKNTVSKPKMSDVDTFKRKHKKVNKDG